MVGESAGTTRDDPPATYAITIALSPRFTSELGRPGVVEAISVAAAKGTTPTRDELISCGQTAEFAGIFVERLRYLVDLKKAGVLKAAGPFAGLQAGMYLCTAPNDQAARRVIEEDPLYRAGYIDRDYRIDRWLVAI